MAYQRGRLKKVKKKKGLTWVLHYRIKGAEQRPLVVGLVENFPTEDDASLEVDRLGLRVRIKGILWMVWRPARRDCHDRGREFESRT